MSPVGPVQRDMNKNLPNLTSDQTQRVQLGEQPIRGRLPVIETIRRRVVGRQITPALERPPRPRQRRHQLLVDLDQAVAAPVIVAPAAKSGDVLAHPDLTADDPIDRAAGEHLLRPPRMVSRIDPIAAALRDARCADTAQMLDILDADGELQQVQRHACGTLAQPPCCRSGAARAISSAPSSTRSPTANLTASTTPSAGAATVCSIFIASMTISGSPRRTWLPGSAISCVTRPGIGAVSRPAVGSSPAAGASGSISTSRQLPLSRNTAVSEP